MKNQRVYTLLLIISLIVPILIITHTSVSCCDCKKSTEDNLPYFYYVLDENDTDGDGMPDNWEELYDLNPEYDDSGIDYDFDMLTNLEEYTYNTNPREQDTDNDGFNDGLEVERGTDPTDPNDHPVRVWIWILVSIASIAIITFAVWAVRITIKDSNEKTDKN